jgi:hypothetical protein
MAEVMTSRMDDDIRNAPPAALIEHFSCTSRYAHTVSPLNQPSPSPSFLRLPRKPFSASSLGTLSILPPEIHRLILPNLDFHSLFHLSLSNSYFHNLVISLPAYVRILTSAPSTIHALVKTGVVGYHNIQIVYSALFSRNCICGDFAPYLFLLTAERACSHCLRNDDHFALTIPWQATRCLGLSAAEVAELSTLHTAEGEYIVDGSNINRYGKPTPSIDLVRVEDAISVMVRRLGSEAAMEEWVLEEREREEPRSEERVREMRSKGRPHVLPPPGRSGLRVWGFERQEFASKSFFALGSMRAPAFDEVLDGQKEDGYWCKGCNQSRRRPARRIGPVNYAELPEVLLRKAYRAFDKERFLEHVVECSAAQQNGSWMLYRIASDSAGNSL